MVCHSAQAQCTRTSGSVHVHVCAVVLAEPEFVVVAAATIERPLHFYVSTMAQKRKGPALPKITDFLSATSSNVRKTAEGGVSPAPAKQSKHHDSYDPKWEEEFTWLRHVPADQEDGSSMFCTLCGKHNETSKRMVWLLRVSFSGQIRFVNMSAHNVILTQSKLKHWL